MERLEELDLSYRAAAMRTNGLISHGHIHQIAHGVVPLAGLGVRSRKGLALALDLPFSVLEKAWEDSVEQPPTRFDLPKKADKLSNTDRKTVLALVDSLLKNYGK